MQVIKRKSYIKLPTRLGGCIGFCGICTPYANEAKYDRKSKQTYN